MAPNFGNNGQLSRDERVQLYGIDCEDQVVWSEWKPGVESVRELVLHNVALVTQKVKYKLPATAEFDMPYPEPFKLAPGMKKSIPINFRPSKYEPHVDQVQIQTKGGTFFVTVKAVVKDIALTVPHFIDFGLRPVNEKSETHIDVYNTGTLKAAMKWHSKPPFTVRSPTDVIEVGQAVRCVVEFEPNTASVFDGLVVCEASNPSATSFAVGDDESLTGCENGSSVPGRQYFIQSTGVGKMPHLCVPGTSNPEVDFGSVFPGNRVSRSLELLNTTPVRAAFKVKVLNEKGEAVALPPNAFSVSPESGEVEPNSSYTLTFFFQSHTVKEHACQRFQISTPGGTPLVVTCTAYCKPMEVRLSTRTINFGEVMCGKVYTQTVQLYNDSDRPASYHFVNMDHQRGYFWMDRHMGMIPANSFMVVTLFFGPNAAINYQKHVFCVVKGAVSPLMLNVIGTAYTDKNRPARLEQKHVDIFRHMQLNDVREHPPPPEKAKDTTQQQPVDDEEDESEQHDIATQAAQTRVLSATATFLEMMLPMDAKQRDITMSPDVLDFGPCSSMSMSDKHTVTITNKTSQKVCVAFMVVGDTRMPCTPDERSVYQVYPPQGEIGSRASADFTVSFRPRCEGIFECAMLEAIVYQKVNRTFRLVDLKRFTPPWSLSIRGMGHTMGHVRTEPNIEISEPHIRFRACHPGERSYQVAMLTNTGDTCVSYSILAPVDANAMDVDATSLKNLAVDVPFRAYPTQGVIEPHQFHLVVVEFAPTAAKNAQAYVANFRVVVDYQDATPKTLRVTGRAWNPQVSLCRGISTVTFPPTCAGIASSMSCIIKNVSEIPITYECKIPTRFRNLFWFSNPSGRLAPSQSSSVVAHFCPDTEKVFSAPLYCVARAVNDADNAVTGPLRELMTTAAAGAGGTMIGDNPNYVLQLVGHGKGPAISLEPDRMDLGAVKAYDEVFHQISILNSSNLTVHYTVTCEFMGSTSEELSQEAGEKALLLGCSEGSVAGRCTETLDVTFQPKCRGIYEYHVVLTPRTNELGADRTTPSGRGVSLLIRADVQFPCIQIADLRTECATLQPQSMMWSQFQVDGINELYRGEVAEVERKFQAAIGIDEKKRLVKQLKPFQLLFGTSAAGSTPTVVYLVLSNPSQLPTSFSFQTPKNLNLENAPYWCDEKALVDDREAHFSWVEEHGIYDIQPRSGEIAPGDYLHVKMTYTHQSIGTHILPVVFNVHDGRSVLFYLKAHSVAPNVGCLSVRSSTVSLQPVPLNVQKGTMQPVELTNSGAIAAEWRLDLGSIQEFNLRNHNCEVLSVSPIEGMLEPCSSTFLHFTFTPLEAKTYTCPVRVEMLKDGRPAEELCFDICADGYDPNGEVPEVEQNFPANLPLQTYAPVPGCGAALSIEVLDFDRCPLRAKASRVLVLVNYTSEFILSYSWEPRGLLDNPDDLRIEPSMGELSPGSHCIVVFHLSCREPADIAGEIACNLQWTHLSEYGQGTVEVQQVEQKARAEYMAFHSDHVHEPMRTGKAFQGGSDQKHISVANRLTVSRFRNLMSSAAGQKFLNENLHRTAVMASHIPTMSPRKAMQASGNKAAMSGGGGPGTEGRPLYAPPTSYPLYVRLRAVVADWAVPPEKKDEFLVMKERPEDEGARSPSSSPRAPTVKGALNCDQVSGTLEHMLREVLAEDEFSAILENMLMEETPNFLQYEDGKAPGDPHLGLVVPDSEDEEEEDELDELDERPEYNWSSDLLLDFDGPALPKAAPEAASAAPAPRTSRSSSALAGLEAPADAWADTPQRYWEETINEYGEPDLPQFTDAAGEVLEGMLLDMVDDVVAGRLNWMRPLPRVRPRRQMNQPSGK